MKGLSCPLDDDNGCGGFRLCNFSAAAQSAAHMKELIRYPQHRQLIGNYAHEAGTADILRPYEASVYLPG